MVVPSVLQQRLSTGEDACCCAASNPIGNKNNSIGSNYTRQYNNTIVVPCIVPRSTDCLVFCIDIEVHHIQYTSGTASFAPLSPTNPKRQ